MSNVNKRNLGVVIKLIFAIVVGFVGAIVTVVGLHQWVIEPLLYGGGICHRMFVNIPQETLTIGGKYRIDDNCFWLPLVALLMFVMIYGFITYKLLAKRSIQ